MAGLPNSSNALQQWHHLFEAQGGPRTPEASQHLQQLLRLGLPTRKHEDWKYTPLDALLNGRFVADEGASLSAEQRDALALPLDAWRLVFIDGRYHPQLSDDLAASGVEVSVDNQRHHLPDALQPEVFLHLTESLAQTVTRIRVPRNRRLDKPLLLMHITSGLAGDALNTAHYRHHLALESGAEATIVEHYLSLNEQPHFTGGRLTMTVADNAHLQHIKLAFENARSYHFAHNDLLLGRDASAFSSSFLLGGQVLRHQTSTRLLAITEVSNVLGTENPLAALIALAHQHGAKVLVDGAQAVMHHPVDVQALGCDFYVFSAHKLYGPTGIGVLYARSELLQTMAPWEGGGSMIATVSLTEGTTWNQAPWRFEAGTPNTGGIIGLGAALTYVSQLGLTQIAEYEQTLMRYALDALRAVPDLILYGPAQRKGVIAFNLGQHHAYDVGSFLDNYGIAVRTGHHCAMPLMARYQVPAMCRASLAMYNTTEEVDRLVAGLQRIRKLLG